jgi:DHA1 family bicyclomycin/chloramphenicol resistance-like MFS transporter
MIRLGAGICLIAVASIAALFWFGALHPAALFLPATFAGLGNGMALPNAISGAISVRPDLAGTAAGLSGSFQVGTGAVVALIVGVLLDLEGDAHTVWPLVAPMLASAVLSVALAAVVDDTRLWAQPSHPR